MIQRLVAFYWRVRWCIWYLPLSPSPSDPDYRAKEKRWKACEPTKGIPPSVRRHREKQGIL
jgi:hypothetical protein